MHCVDPPASDVAFSSGVKALQARHGSRAAYARMEAAGGWATRITEELGHFIARQDSVFLATASADGQPYVQHRGGPPGFLHVIDAQTLAFAEFDGNRQFITQGNLAENPRAQLFLIDYSTRQRVKIWGRARVVEDDPDLVRSLMPPPEYRARASRAIVFDVIAWDANCPQHIPRRVAAIEARHGLGERGGRILPVRER